VSARTGTKARRSGSNGSNGSNGAAGGVSTSPRHAAADKPARPITTPTPGNGTAVSANGSAPNGTGRRPLSAEQLRRLGLVSLAIVLLGALVGYGAALLWPPQYAARADILFEITEEKPTGFLREDRSLTTQLVVLRSRQVLGPVAAAEGIPVEEFEKTISFSVVDSSEVIQVEVTDGSPDVALRRLQAVVDRYFEIAAQDRASEVGDFLRAQLTEVRDQLTAARARLNRFASDPAALTEVESLVQREQQLLGRLDELGVAERVAPRREVLVPPYLVPDPVSPRPALAAGAGALTALVIATGAVFLLARRWAKG